MNAAEVGNGTSSPVAARVLAEYASELRFEDLPPRVVTLARQCLIDAVACVVFGRDLPWSRILFDQVVANGTGGPCRMAGLDGVSLSLPQAALLSGAFCHAFELDSLRKPGAGVHPGATVALPALAAAQAVGASGRDLITAVVAGCEVMFRIGAATLHTPEKAGFHAPGITGPFGSAVACGRLLGLSSAQLTQAMGICGSLSGGLLAFVKSGGGMVKRLHLGRAAEGGVVAAQLAERGYEGPERVLEGQFGVLDAFCESSDPALMTTGLGEVYEIEKLCLKRYACHVTAQAPMQFLRDQMAAHGFAGDGIAAIRVRGSAKLVSHHGNPTPSDVMLAQYSLPFALATGAYADPEEPNVFSAALHDARVYDLARRIEIPPGAAPLGGGWGAELEIMLENGRTITGIQESFAGCPDTPFSREQLLAKFSRLGQSLGKDAVGESFQRLWAIETLPDVSKVVVC